jgi:hypothetical protein
MTHTTQTRKGNQTRKKKDGKKNAMASPVSPRTQMPLETWNSTNLEQRRVQSGGAVPAAVRTQGLAAAGARAIEAPMPPPPPQQAASRVKQRERN